MGRRQTALPYTVVCAITAITSVASAVPAPYQRVGAQVCHPVALSQYPTNQNTTDVTTVAATGNLALSTAYYNCPWDDVYLDHTSMLNELCVESFATSPTAGISYQACGAQYSDGINVACDPVQDFFGGWEDVNIPNTSWAYAGWYAFVEVGTTGGSGGGGSSVFTGMRTCGS